MSKKSKEEEQLEFPAPRASLSKVESYFNDRKWDVDEEHDRFRQIFHDIAIKNQGKNDGLYNAADEMDDIIANKRFNEVLDKWEDVKERLDRLNLGEATERDVKQYLYGQQGTYGASKKTMKKYGMEASDIKGLMPSFHGSSNTETTNSLTVEKSTPTDVVSSTWEEPVQSTQAANQSSTDLSNTSEIKRLMEEVARLSERLSALAPPQGGPQLSSSASSSTVSSLLNREIANKILSKKALGKR